MSNRKHRSELSEDMELLRELTQKNRSGKEPGRHEYVLAELRKRGFQPEDDAENKCIRFSFQGNVITVWPYKGWFSGKGVKDGRGISKLLKQLDR